LQNLFPPKGSLVNAPKKKKKGGGKEKQKKRGGEKAKGKRRKGSETLLSAHARTLKAVIWHQEQKLDKSSARLVDNALDSLDSFRLDSGLKTAWLASKGIFWQNVQESMG